MLTTYTSANEVVFSVQYVSLTVCISKYNIII